MSSFKGGEGTRQGKKNHVKLDLDTKSQVLSNMSLDTITRDILPNEVEYKESQCWLRTFSWDLIWETNQSSSIIYIYIYISMKVSRQRMTHDLL